jgi:hypothetical protein
MQEWTFCCDYLVLVSNCAKNPKAELLKNKKFDFTKINLEFEREIYEERPHKKKAGERAEFYSNVFGTFEGERKKIGEFQIHFKSRTEIKFRFHNSLFA